MDKLSRDEGGQRAQTTPVIALKEHWAGNMPTFMLQPGQK